MKKVSDKDFRLAMTEMCRRAIKATYAWSHFKVRFDPKWMKLDQAAHARLWDLIAQAKFDTHRIASGLLGILPTEAMNEQVRRSLPELLEAARRNQPKKRKG